MWHPGCHEVTCLREPCACCLVVVLVAVARVAVVRVLRRRRGALAATLDHVALQQQLCVGIAGVRYDTWPGAVVVGHTFGAFGSPCAAWADGGDATPPPPPPPPPPWWCLQPLQVHAPGSHLHAPPQQLACMGRGCVRVVCVRGHATKAVLGGKQAVCKIAARLRPSEPLHNRWEYNAKL